MKQWEKQDLSTGSASRPSRLAAMGMALASGMYGIAAQAQTALPAGTPADAAAAGGPVSGLASLVPMVIFFGIFFFLVILPQRKRQKEQDAMLQALKAGDSVLTSSGFIGKIHQVENHWVLLELADNVRVKLVKSQVTKVLTGDGAIPATV
jgi:preprotein translocase subunit YajC